jgi:hypothetical protein
VVRRPGRLDPPRPTASALEGGLFPPAVAVPWCLTIAPDLAQGSSVAAGTGRADDGLLPAEVDRPRSYPGIRGNACQTCRLRPAVVNNEAPELAEPLVHQNALL